MAVLRRDLLRGFLCEYAATHPQVDKAVPPTHLQAAHGTHEPCGWPVASGASFVVGAVAGVWGQLEFHYILQGADMPGDLRHVGLVQQSQEDCLLVVQPGQREGGRVNRRTLRLAEPRWSYRPSSHATTGS